MLLDLKMEKNSLLRISGRELKGVKYDHSWYPYELDKLNSITEMRILYAEVAKERGFARIRYRRYKIQKRFREHMVWNWRKKYQTSKRALTPSHWVQVRDRLLAKQRGNRSILARFENGFKRRMSKYMKFKEEIPSSIVDNLNRIVALRDEYEQQCRFLPGFNDIGTKMFQIHITTMKHVLYLKFLQESEGLCHAHVWIIEPSDYPKRLARKVIFDLKFLVFSDDYMLGEFESRTAGQSPWSRESLYQGTP